MLDDSLDVRHEAHVEHPVGLVEHEVLDVFQRQIFLGDMIEQTPGRGDDDVGSSFQLIVLLAVLHAAVNNGCSQIGVLRKIPERRLDLRGQLARRLDDQCARILLRLVELRENRQAERRRLAGAGLGAADQVAALEKQRDAPELNRRRIFVTHRANPLENVVGKPQ